MVASIVAACGCGDRRGLTEPTAPSAPSEVFIHNTLNPGANRSLAVYFSYSYTSAYDIDLPMFSTLTPWTWDDFTSPVTDMIRTVSWQGGYCRRQDLFPIGPPPATSPSFQVAFSPDNNGRPPFYASLYGVTFTPAETREQFAFNSFWNELDCVYYDYTAVLPTPFPVTAGTRYWLLIRGQIGGPSDSPWGWRAGTQDDGMSAHGTAHQENIVMLASDLAFSLSSR